MEYRYLTGTGIKISRVCLGTMVLGGQTGEQEGIDIIRKAYDSGVTFFDTANRYSGGQSEVVVGKALKGIRDNVILATKVCHPGNKTMNDQGLSRKHILDALDESLQKLQTDYIDLYYLHMMDFHTPLEETLDTMTTIVRSGKARYIGISNFAAWYAMKARHVSDMQKGIPPVVSQNVYNLITRGIESELIPMLADQRMGLVAYNPLAGGMLTGKHMPGEPTEGTRFTLMQSYFKRYWMNENFEAVNALKATAEKFGMSLAELALRWTLTNPMVDSVLMGASKISQVEQNIAAAENGPLPADAMAECDAVWDVLKGTRYGYMMSTDNNPSTPKK